MHGEAPGEIVEQRREPRLLVGCRTEFHDEQAVTGAAAGAGRLARRRDRAARERAVAAGRGGP
ncbi:hypothetical protein SH611_18915, partial [Geminicoccaceae bacterium 1502E]|nr:hypothetical protein [Geminicoccaceae bacterium 1502E]